MIDVFRLVEYLKSRINPAYADWAGTESHERAQCVAALEQLQVELMAKRQHLAGAFSQLQEAEKEAEELREQLAQEKARLDWALETAATYYEWQGKHYLSYDVPENDGYEVVESVDPRATIDELIAAEAAGGGK